MDFRFPHLPYAEDKVFGFLFLIVLVVPLAFNLYAYENFEIIKYTLLLVLVGGALLVASRQNLSWPKRQGWPWLLGLFWLWALIVSLFAWDKNYSFFGFYPRLTNGLVFYTLLALLLWLFCFLAAEKLQFLLKTLNFAASLVALRGLMESVGWGIYLGLSGNLFNRSAPSFLGNPDFSSMFVAAAVFLSLLFLYRARGAKAKIYYGLCLVIQLGSLVIFASRGALLGGALGLAVMVALSCIFFRKHSWQWLALLLTTAVVSVALAVGFFNFARPNDIAATASLQDTNIQSRLGVWRLAWQSMEKRPWFGVGLGNFQLMFEHDRTSPIVPSGFFDDAHNLFFELAVTGGWPLALLFFSLVAWAAVLALAKLPTELLPEASALLAALAAWTAAAMFTPVPTACYMELALLLAACFVMFRKSPHASLPLPSSIKKFLLPAGAVLLLAGLAFAAAEALFFSGIQAYNSNNFIKAYQETNLAIKLNPTNKLYYVYRAGSAIRANLPLAQVNQLIGAAQKINPRRANSYVELANLDYLLLYRTGDPMYRQQILQNLQTAINLDKFFAANYFLMSQYQLVFGNPSAAISNAQTGLAIDPSATDAWLLEAKVYQLENNRPELLNALKQVYETQSDDPALVRLWHLAQQTNNLQTLPLNVDFSLGQVN